MTSKHKTIETHMSARKRPYGTLHVKVTDKNGMLKESTEQIIDSFLYSHWNMMFSRIKSGSDSSTASSMNGTSVTYSYNADMIGTSSTGYAGVVVGSGSTAVSFADTQLASIIQHGTGAGQLSFQDNSTAIFPDSYRQYLQRTFQNNSGSPITVSETGVAVSSGTSVSALGSCVLVVRDVLNTPVTVSAGDTLSVVYEFKVTKALINWFQLNMQNLIGGSVSDSTCVVTQLLGVSSAGTSGSIRSYSTRGGFLADAGQNTIGIVASTDNSDGNIRQIRISNIIGQGINAGQLLAFSCNVVKEEIDNTNGTAILDIRRSYFNNSGGEVTIKSLGLRSTFGFSIDTYSYIVDWQTLPSPITLTNGNGETFTWRFSYEL
jgi:hypothetical protein